MNPARRTTATVATALVLATAGGLLTAAAAPASAATTCTSPVYKRQFFANTAFSGTAKKTDCDAAIDQNWGSGAPASGLPKDKFGVRWTVTRDFGSGGPFSFAASTQDGIRVYLDGTRKVDIWKNVSTTVKKTVNITIPKGTHTLRVDYVNWTGTANVKFAYTPRTSATVDKVKPLTPTGTAVTYDKTTGKAKLTWAKNKELDLAGYRVYRRLKGSTAWTKLTTTTATSYTDATVPKTGKTYYYEVRAHDKAGNSSAGTADKPVTTVDKTPPAAPFVEMDACPDLQPYAAPELVTTAENKADIAWYEMQRLNAATGAWSTIYSGAKGAICDTGYRLDGSKVTYRGRARDAAGNWSAYSAATTFTTGDLTPPAPVTDARIEYESGVPHLVWSPVDGTSAYQVLQYVPSTGGYLDALAASTGSTVTTTTATDVVPMQRLAVSDSYRYVVRSVDAAGNAAAPAEVELALAERPEPVTAHQVTATAYGQWGVRLDWRTSDPWAIDDSRQTSFRILRTDTTTGTSTVVDQCVSQMSPESGTLESPYTYTYSWISGTDPAYAKGSRTANSSCLDASGESETAYEYRIIAVDSYGHVSAPSTASATATTPDTLRPGPVGDLTAERIPMGVRLTWTAPTDDPDPVQGYLVWQGSTDPDTGETVWKRNCWGGDSLGETEILCATVPDGKEHVYRVVGYDYFPGTDIVVEDFDESEYTPQSYHPVDVRVTLPDTRPPGWTGTDVGEDQYPDLYRSCNDNLFSTVPCTVYQGYGYRVERWDPTGGTWSTLDTGVVGDGSWPSFMDTTVNADHLALYYYRVVYISPEGVEETVRSQAFGIWESWL
ncbi:PA14 domain-containing protein [Streptomyces sp. NPDC058614]|uniref:PA14 domain-containing protein n=1 Tax=Streptomyces sp. NPDC058614 TaxID=3346557 RepID=UPI00365F7216